MKISNAREATLRAVKNFPRWMDIRKRYRSSTGGQLLSALMEENAEVQKAYEEFKKGFFLKNYLDHEDEVLCQIYLAHVGSLTSLSSVDERYEVTTDPYLFVSDTTKYVLYQNDQVLIDPALVDEKHLVFKYKVGDEIFQVPIAKHDLWNVFDEFAMFCSLERYEGESNSALTKRILASFKRPTNGTEKGLKNAIINALANDVKLSESDIVFEQPSGTNILCEMEDGRTIYDALSSLNQDIAREKVWNHSYWENGFKKLQYIPNAWDAPIEGYQNGTGQRHDLETKLTSDDGESESTDLEVTGYAANTIVVNEYIHKQGIKKTIPLQLTQYRDELASKEVKYQIVATEAIKVDPAQIYLQGMKRNSGESKIYLSDIMIDKGNLTEIGRGDVSKDGIYTLKFYPKEPYSDMRIYHCNFISKDGTKSDLLTRQGSFQWDNGAFRNTAVKLHATAISDLFEVSNMENDVDGGITVGKNGTSGSFSVNVSGMNGEPIFTKVKCQETNYTDNRAFVSLTGGFHYTNDNTEAYCSTDDSESQIIVDMDCATLSYELVLADEEDEQGCISVEALIDGKVDANYSGLKTAGGTYRIELGSLHHVKLTITKTGLYPVSIRNICAARYNITYQLDRGELITTKNSTHLPSNVGMSNYLHVQVSAGSTHSPVIEYLHIGPSSANSCYTVSGVRSGNGGTFDIESDCRVELISEEDGRDMIVTTDFRTRPIYRNDRSETVSAFIDTSSFLSIYDVSRPIYSGAYRGRIASYIELAPGEEVDSITIRGEQKTVSEKRSLSYYVQKNYDDKVYVAGNAPGFIVVDKNGCARLVQIRKRDLGLTADEFSFSGLPSNTSGTFVINENNHVTSVTNSFDRDFDYCYIATVGGKEHIAYNSVKMLQSPMTNIKLVNTFSPYLDTNKLIFYRISSITMEGARKASARFAHVEPEGLQYYDWSFGDDYDHIRLEYDFDFSNSDMYQVTVSNLNESFTISNNIELKKKYSQNGNTFEMARFIIKPPENMRITYGTETAQEKVIIEEDGFNKLYFSNVRDIKSISINGAVLSSKDYKILKDAGIIVWSRLDELKGLEAVVVYEYRAPKSLEFKDLSYLYEMVGYSTDAYEPINSKPIIVTGMKDGETRSLVINGKIPDKVAVRCLNSNFTAAISKDKVTVHRYSNAVVAMVHSGYYYDGADEYFLYGNDHEEKVSCYENVEFENVEHLADTVRTRQPSSNYVKDTIFIGGKTHEEELCRIDCLSHQEKIDGVSLAKEITACESYQLWNDFNMDISLVEGYNGNGLKFEPQHPSAFAFFELTSYLEDDTDISFAADKTLTASIMEEVLAEEDSMSRSVHAQFFQSCERKHSRSPFITCRLKDLKPGRRYYLMLRGSGMFDDLIIRKHDDDVDIEKLHHKVIDIFDFKIKEFAQKEYQAKLDFDRNGNSYDGLEMNGDGLLETGSSVDWGVTFITDFQDHLDEFTTENVFRKKGAFYTESQAGKITSPWVEIRDYQAVGVLYVKLNRMLVDPMRNFNIRLLTAADQNGTNAKEINVSKKTNLLEFGATFLHPFVQIVVEMPPERVIENIEIYTRYVEEQAAALHVAQNYFGSMTTKIYNTAVAANYRPKYMRGSVTRPDDITIYVRGYRQDEDHGTWTKWYPCNFDKHMIFSDQTHTFEGYQYFQFKINITDMNASIKIDEIILEVI